MTVSLNESAADACWKRCSMAAVAAPKIWRERYRKEREKKRKKEKRGEGKERKEKVKKKRGDEDGKIYYRCRTPIGTVKKL